MKKERKVWAMTLIAFWWLAPNQTNAQQDSLQSKDLDAVVVTATKFPKNISETGKVLTVIDELQLSRSAGKDVSQLLNEQVGLVINGANSNPGKDKSVFLRGAASGYTLILLDGIPVNDPSGVGGAFDLRLLPVDQIERVEILKGSQSTLYGTDAIAGVINIITKKKGDKPVSGSALVSYGSYNTFKGSVGLSGSMQKIDYNIGYTRYSTDGISEAKDSTGNAGYDKDGYTQDAFQANLGFNVNKSLSIRPYFRYNNFDGNYDASGFTDSKKDHYKTNLMNTGLSAQYLLSKGAVNVLYGYDKTDRDFDTDFGPLNYKGRFQHAEAFWNNELSTHVQMLAGLGFQEIHMIDTSAAEKNPTVTITSPYVSMFLKNVGGLSVELGGRYNSHSKFGNNFTYSFNPSYLIHQQLKVFVNASTGFKAPTLNQLFGQYGPNPDLKPEKSQNLEGGVQFFSADKNIDIRVTAFARNITDVIYYSFDPVTFASKYINLNKQDDSGFETEIGWKPNTNTTLRAFYAYVDGYITDKSSGTEVKSYNLIRRPRNSFGLNLGWQVTQDFFVSTNLKTFGKRSDLYYNSATFTTQNVSMDAYYLWDLYLEYKLAKDKVKIFVDGKNLLNQDYMEVYGYNTLKFNAMAGINFRL